MVGFTKGSRVEVSSDDEGFRGAWYVATVVDVVAASPTNKKASNRKNKNRKLTGYLVKYDTLVREEDTSVRLTEVVDSSFVRPLPPRYFRRKNGDSGNVEVVEEEEEGSVVDLTLCDIVDAFHLDGWWTGVVSKVVVDDEIKKFVVAFESPPEQFEFERTQLRLHLDWIDCCWRARPKKTTEQALAHKDATQTPKSNTDAHSGFVTPSKGALTGDHSDQQIVAFQPSPKKKSRSLKKETNGKTYVRIKTTGRCVQEKSHAKRFKPSSGSKENTEHMGPVMEAGGLQAMHEDPLRLEQEMIMTETHEAEDGTSPEKRKRGRPPKLCGKRPNTSSEDNQEAGERDSLAIDALPGELDEQPLSVWYQGLHPLTVLKNSRSSYCSALDRNDGRNGAVIQAIFNNGETPEKHQELPFIKRSPVWTTIESLESYQTPPQKPHFSPLKKIKDDYREGLAIAHVVTFVNLVQRTSQLQLADPNDIIESSLETLRDLETHGFDVGAVQARLNKLLSSKTKVGKLEDKLKEVASDLKKCNLERSIVEDEINELEAKMKELQEKLVLSVSTKNAKDDEIMTLQSNLHLVAEQVADEKHNFEKLLTTPL